MSKWSDEMRPYDRENLVDVTGNEYGGFSVRLQGMKLQVLDWQDAKAVINEIAKKHGHKSAWDLLDEVSYKDLVETSQDKLKKEVDEIFTAAMDLVEAAILRMEDAMQKKYEESAKNTPPKQTKAPNEKA